MPARLALSGSALEEGRQGEVHLVDFALFTDASGVAAEIGHAHLPSRLWFPPRFEPPAHVGVECSAWRAWVWHRREKPRRRRHRAEQCAHRRLQ